MKKAINPKLMLGTALALAVILSAVLFIPSSIFASDEDDVSKHYGTTLKVGRYAHTSGDEGKYVEVFEDHTIQVYGYNCFEETINHPENKDSLEFYNSLTEDELKETPLWKDSVWFNERHHYTVDKDVNFAVFVDLYDSGWDLTPYGFEGKEGRISNSGLAVKDKDGKILEVNADNIYVYSGN